MSNYRKRMTISKTTNEKLLEILGNNYEVGQFITYLVEKTTYKINKSTIRLSELDIEIARKVK